MQPPQRRQPLGAQGSARVQGTRRSDRILAIIIAGEPNADDPAKAREGILRDEECFCEELRFGAVRDDGTLDWTIRTEPLAADLRPTGTRAEGFVTAEAYREHLTLNSSLTPDKISARTEAYRQQLDHALLKIIAGLLGVALGTLKDRDAAHHTALAEAEAAKQREIAARERRLAEEAHRSAEEAHRARLATERTARRLAIAGASALVLALLTGWFWWQAGREKNEADRQRTAAQTQAEKARVAALEANKQRAAAQTALVETDKQRAAAQIALAESNRHLERSQVEEGRAWLERGRASLNKGDHLGALMLAGRAIGYQGYGRAAQEAQLFAEAFPLLLARPMKDPTAENERADEAREVTKFLDSVQPTHLPHWAGSMTKAVTCVAFSPDGTRLASGSEDNTIQIWDTTSGKGLASLRGHTSYVSSIAFSPDCTRLASGSWDNTIKLWDTATGKEAACLQGHTNFVKSVAFSPDSTRVASGSDDHTIRLWDSTSGEELACLVGHAGRVTSIAFSSDGTRLASASDDKTLKLWDTSDGKELASFLGHTIGVTSVAFSPDGTRLVSGSWDETIKLWEVSTRKEIVTLVGHKDAITSVAFSQDGTRLASGSSDYSYRIWDPTSAKELSVTRGHEGPVECAVFSPDGLRLASCSSGGTVKIWDVAPGRSIVSFVGHVDSVGGASLSPDGALLASASDDQTIRLWDTATGKELALMGGHTQVVTSVIFSPDGRHVASGSADHTVKFWETATGKEIGTLVGHTNRVENIAFSSNGLTLASASWDRTIKLWDTRTQKEVATLEGHTDDVVTVAFSPDNTRLVSGSADETLRFWNLATHSELACLTPHRGEVRAVAFSADGKLLASACGDDWFGLWGVTSGKDLLTTIPGAQDVANQVLYAGQHLMSPDNSLVADRDDDDLKRIFVSHNPRPKLALATPLRNGLVSILGREVHCPKAIPPTPTGYVGKDTLALLADPKFTPERRAELRMELCTKSSQFRAATALWQRLLQGEWPGFEGATVPKDQAPATIPADSPIRRLYLLALIDATKHPQIHGHPTICQAALQIAPVLTKEMMATPTISLAMMSLMQTLAKDDSPDISATRAALLKRLAEVATKEWLAVLRETTAGVMGDMGGRER